jgi:hypothetical protein
MKRVVVIAVAALLVLYVVDTLAVWIPFPPGRRVYDEVQVRVFYAMSLKGNRTEYRDGGIQKQTCVNALFPHFGDSPCWYAARHTEKWLTE